MSKPFPTATDRQTAYQDHIAQYYADRVSAANQRAQEDALKAAMNHTQYDAQRAANQRAQNAYNSAYNSAGNQHSGHAQAAPQIAPGWICPTCHFANEAASLLSVKCKECGSAK